MTLGSAVTYWAAAAASISAAVATTLLVLTLRSRRPRLEVRFPADFAQGSEDGEGTRVFNPVAKNVRSVPATVKIDLLLDGAPVGKPSQRVTIPPAQHESFALHLPITLYERVTAGARLEACVHYRRWLAKPAIIGRGERKTV